MHSIYSLILDDLIVQPLDTAGIAFLRCVNGGWRFGAEYATNIGYAFCKSRCGKMPAAILRSFRRYGF